MFTKGLKRLLRDLDLHLAVLCLACLITVTFLGVIMRYLFNSPFTWQDEVQMTLFLWAICFGGSAAFRSGGHIAIDLLVDLFPKNVQKAIHVAIWFISSGVLGFLAWNSMGFVVQQIKNNRVTDVMKFPRSVVYAPLPVCSVLMILFFGWSTWKKLKIEEEGSMDAH